MNVKFLYSNIPLKLLAIFLALVAWVYVANKDFHVGTVDQTIPVVAENLGANLALTDTIPSATIKVRTTKDLSAVQAKDFVARVDLSGLGSGSHKVPVVVSTTLPNTQILSVNPQSISVTIEAKTEKTFPVTLETSGAVAENFATGEAKVEPNIVTVTGAASVVGRISKVTAKLVLNGEKTDIKRSVALQAQSESSVVLSAVVFDPATVTVSVPVQRTNATKTVKVNLKTSGAPASGFSLVSATVAPGEVEITGKESDLAKVSSLDTNAVDLNGLTADTTKVTTLALPEGISLAQETQITATLKVTAKVIERNLQVDVQFSGLGSGLSIVSFVPARVVVVVSGAANKVNSISESDVKLTVSLAGLTQGEHTIPFALSQVSTPQDITAKSIQAASVVVTIGPTNP